MKHMKMGLLLLASTLVASCAHAPQMAVRAASSGAVLNDDAASAMARGRSLYEKGEFAMAVDAFRQAVRAAPDSADGYNALAAAYDRLGRFDLSARNYELALAYAPSDGRVYRNMARSLRMQGRVGEAEALLAEWEGLKAEQSAAVAVAREPDGAPKPMAAMAEPATPVAQLASVPPMQAASAPTAPAPILPAPMAAIPSPTPPIARGRTVAIALAPPAPVALPSVPVIARGRSVSVALDTPRPAPRQMTLRIMNAGGKRGLARNVQGMLIRSGWARAQIGDYDRRMARSWIVYPRSAQAEAAAIGRKLPFAVRRVVDDRVRHVTLVLGRNASTMPQRRTHLAAL